MSESTNPRQTLIVKGVTLQASQDTNKQHWVAHCPIPGCSFKSKPKKLDTVRSSFKRHFEQNHPDISSGQAAKPAKPAPASANAQPSIIPLLIRLLCQGVNKRTGTVCGASLSKAANSSYCNICGADIEAQKPGQKIAAHEAVDRHAAQMKISADAFIDAEFARILRVYPELPISPPAPTSEAPAAMPEPPAATPEQLQAE
jgi:hypothetical protein